MDQTRRIALLLDRGLSFVRGVIRGMRAYAADKPNWVLRDVPPRSQLVSHVRDWKPHGIIAGLVLPRVAQELIRMRTPLIDTAYVLSGLKVPTVDVDHAAVGRLAAEYLLERKFDHFGFFGSKSAAYSRIRESAFRERVVEAGHGVTTCHIEYLADLTTPAVWKKSAQKTRRWLRQLPKPAAILCGEDAPARHLADVCRQLDLNIPEDITLLGAGNDELECTLSQPAISSIAVPSQRIGYEAAELLDRLMSGEARPREPLLLPPLHVVTRHSTDIMAIEDETVQAALQYIRQHAWEAMSVAGATISFHLGSIGAGGDFRGTGRASQGTAHRHGFAHHGPGRTVRLSQRAPSGRSVRQTNGPLAHSLPPSVTGRLRSAQKQVDQIRNSKSEIRNKFELPELE